MVIHSQSQKVRYNKQAKVWNFGVGSLRGHCLCLRLKTVKSFTIHLVRHFCCRMYRLPIIHFARQTDIVTTIADLRLK